MKKFEFIAREPDKTWCKINCVDYGTGVKLNGIYGVTIENKIVDSDGCPLSEGDWKTIAVRNTIKIYQEDKTE